MYEYLFDTKLATLLVAMVLAWLAVALVGRRRMVMRSILFSYGPSFACAFFVVGFFFDGPVSGFDLAAGLLLEFSVLLAFTKLFCDVAAMASRGADDRDIEKWLWSTLVLQLVLALPVVTSEGFGIFSDGSRIAYLDNSGANKYFTYAAVLISAVQAGLIALRLSAGRSAGAIFYIVVVVTFAASLLSGSKGAFFLWLASTLALVDYRRVRIHWLPLLASLTAAVAALVFSVSTLSDVLGISSLDFAELAVARFFLNNDARALALDFGGAAMPVSELLSASFRGVANLLGHPPSDMPLGLLLNVWQTGFDTGTGPNASLIALITYYSTRGYALLPALVACIGVASLYAAVVGFRRMVHGTPARMAASLIGIVLVQLLSQDFLAFPLGIALACAAGLILLIIDRKDVRARIRRLARPTRLAAT